MESGVSAAEGEDCVAGAGEAVAVSAGEGGSAGDEDGSATGGLTSGDNAGDDAGDDAAVSGAALPEGVFAAGGAPAHADARRTNEKRRAHSRTDLYLPVNDLPPYPFCARRALFLY